MRRAVPVGRLVDLFLAGTAAVYAALGDSVVSGAARPATSGPDAWPERGGRLAEQH